MTTITDNGFARVDKNSIIRDFNDTGALTAADIAYDGVTTVEEKIIAIEALGGGGGGGGTGDVVGPASATDNAVARFDATTGKLIQNSAVTIADTTGDITGGKYNTVAISGSSTPTLAVTGTTSVSGANTGDQTSIVGITGTKAQFDTAVTDGNFLYVGDVTSNATHTGEITGATALTVDKTAITGKTAVTPATDDYILISDTSDTGNLKKALISGLPTGGSSLKLPTYTVGASGADYTTIQAAIDAATTGGTIYVTDGTYTLSSQLLFKYANTRIIGNGHSTKIQADCATVTTMIGYNANGLNNCGMENFYIANTNATTQGIGLNFSNQALGTYRNLYFSNLGTAIRANDTVDQTFYNKFEDIKIYECNNGLDFISTNPFNDNEFTNVRTALKTGGTGKGLYMNNAQGNTFHNCNFEPSSGNTGIHLDTNLVINTTFYDVYIEGNTLGVSITAAQRTTFIGGMIVANTTNITDTGLSTQYIGTNVNYAIKNEMVNLALIDKSTGSAMAADIKNNTTYAHTGAKLASIELLNGSDTSKVLEIKNAGSGNSLSVMQGASEVASVSAAGKITTLSTIELGNATDTTISRVSAGVAAIEGKNIALNGTGETFTTGTIELGAASDTTLSRSSAGIIAVEGVTVPLNSTTNTHTAQQIELGHASDTTVTRVSAGKIAVEGVNVGTEGILQNSQSAAYTTVLADAGKHIYHPSADTSARTWTIDSNANVAYPIGTAITFVNDTSAGVITIAITSDTMILAGAGTTGSRTLAANGIATAVKMTSTRWIISGTGLT